LKLVKPPYLLRILFPSLIWRFSVKEKVIYLTFDDGPIPELTPWVLETLNKFEAKATFFCVGENVLKHPDIFKKIISDGHSVGNHTHNHLNAWKNKHDFYIENVKKSQSIIPGNLFRPPYGKITRKLIKNPFLIKYYKIIFWDVLSYDFDQSISPQQCYMNVIKNKKPGSIVVFHDNIKAEKNLKYALPKLLENLKNKGYKFEAIKLN
jgi:peptidoglycan/xylan/chitin deacetylase (PgdA/CDA1 family)